MNLTEQQKKGQDVFFRIISEAWENTHFKQALLDNPEKTLEQLFGRTFSMGKRIKVTDQSDPTYLYINIPVKPQQEEPVSDQAENVAADTDSGSVVMTDYESLYDSLNETDR